MGFSPWKSATKHPSIAICTFRGFWFHSIRRIFGRSIDIPGCGDGAINRDSGPQAEACGYVREPLRGWFYQIGVGVGYKVPSRDAAAVKRRPHVAMGFSP